MRDHYLKSVRKQFDYIKNLAEKTFDMVPEERLFWQYNHQSNSISIIVNHLAGNMKSRWTEFLSSDGEKEWRNRDQEFEDIIKSKAELLTKWNEGWDCLWTALDSLNESTFDQTIYIRNQGHTVVEAINRQVGHYSYHVGQIVFLGKMIAGDDWKSLSIPKGKSVEYNSEKFAKDKHKAHFSDEFIEKE